MALGQDGLSEMGKCWLVMTNTIQCNDSLGSMRTWLAIRVLEIFASRLVPHISKASLFAAGYRM